MATTRLISTAICLLVVFAALGTPAFADDVVPPPPPPPPGVMAPVAPPPPVTVDELPPAWKSGYTAPPAPVAGPGGSVNYMMIRDVCCDRRDECGWRLDARGCRYGRFDLTLEGMYSLADQPEGVLGVPVARVAPGPVLPNQLDWGQIDTDDAFGGRAGLAFAVSPFSRLELRGTYYGNFTGSSQQTGAFGFMPGGGGIGGVSEVSTTTLEVEADLYSGEFNYWEEVSCSGKSRFDLGGGLRFIRFEETAAATGWSVPVIPAGGAPSLSCVARSDFAGVQLGGGWHHDFSPCFELRAIGKVLVGNITQTNRVRDSNILSGGAHQSRVEVDEIRLGADVDLGFLWRLHPRIGITFGYNLLVLDGVARANEAMDFTASTSGAVQAQSHDGQLINHSFFVGVNFNF